MKFRKMGLKWMLCLIPVVGLVVVILYFSLPALPFGHPMHPRALRKLQWLMLEDVTLSVYMPDEAEVFQLVEGDVLALERWLAGKHDEWLAFDESGDQFYSWLGRAAAVVKREPSGEFHLVDAWGHRLVYRCPHPNPAYVWQLYSIGPNGIDEGGQGDDIEKPVPYKSISC